ncbi:hypothetical protein [Bacillus sp. FJAT-29814]|uniref:hypothetical protein n=1 Tax=Bacillus sp. FJAT-29814 TaxID=1729688 RepID=UPI0008313A43|nr:hypothetical protein [Bacillus sp. FJAT-29814]
MKKIFSGLAAGALTLGILASSAFAAVTFDPTTGTGFVGKGDVQTALGYNNAKMQAEAKNLVFTYKSQDTYAITVTWTTGEGTKGEQTHYVTHERSSTVNSGVSYDPRKANQYTGFILTGLENTSETGGAIPKVGDVFPGNSGHVVEEVQLISTTGGLYVNGVAIQ